MPRSADNTTDQRLTALEHACRGVVGDRLRSVSVDGPDHSTTLYRRSDLSPGADAPVHEAMAEGASCQSPVFADGGRTVCSFENGYVTRIRVGETSVVATSDGIKMDRDTELSAAVRGILHE
ncbi:MULTISPECIES: DUF7522 family protein [Halolamina]|uniref:Uncharacterized protein n=1 Tax=Halolamina pelagica TaxID=699431 RepID=A0A1I5NP42_9EURY|nr:MULTISPECIES: hypothetical protein [Halolamina]NHX36393.1 hypothetical protein [Halolamina sp. R1-12]SFP23076.1 hypothetical protein SAMN05216277_102108 [Halolamina pelagica]